MFGYTVDDVIKQNIDILMPSPDQQQHDSYLKNHLNIGWGKIIGTGREVIGQRKNGNQFPIEISVAEIILENERIFTGIIHDISERKTAKVPLTIQKMNRREMRCSNPVNNSCI